MRTESNRLPTTITTTTSTSSRHHQHQLANGRGGMTLAHESSKHVTSSGGVAVVAAAAATLHHTHSVLSTLQDINDLSDEQQARNLAFRRNVASIAKLKSPERKILYNEWFTIIKRMERDPKFDLEALVRTRGRFTEHDHIAYRDRFYKQQQQQQNQHQQSQQQSSNSKLRCARSEPNFTSMMYLTSSGEFIP